MIDKEILFKEYENKMQDAEDYANDSVKSLQENYETEEELLNAIQNYYGYSNLKEFKEYITLNYFRDLATDDYAKSQVTDEAINKYYEEETVGDIEASHILITVNVKDDATDEEKEKAEKEALKKANEVIEKLNKGEKFEDLAKSYSEDDSNKNNGGALSKFNKGDMVKEFETAAYDLKVNEYTKEPVKTSYGYHIILKTKEYDKDKLENVKEDICCIIYNEFPYLSTRKYLNFQSRCLSLNKQNICLGQCSKKYYSKDVIGSLILEFPCSYCKYSIYIENNKVYNCEFMKNAVGNIEDFKTLDLMWNDLKILDIRKQLIDNNRCEGIK
jgi:parvulin-like peptidyl-prolyl isomerase